MFRGDWVPVGEDDDVLEMESEDSHTSVEAPERSSSGKSHVVCILPL